MELKEFCLKQSKYLHEGVYIFVEKNTSLYFLLVDQFPHNSKIENTLCYNLSRIASTVENCIMNPKFVN